MKIALIFLICLISVCNGQMFNNYVWNQHCHTFASPGCTKIEPDGSCYSDCFIVFPGREYIEWQGNGYFDIYTNIHWFFHDGGVIERHVVFVENGGYRILDLITPVNPTEEWIISHLTGIYGWN